MEPSGPYWSSKTAVLSGNSLELNGVVINRIDQSMAFPAQDELPTSSAVAAYALTIENNLNYKPAVNGFHDPAGGLPVHVEGERWISIGTGSGWFPNNIYTASAGGFWDEDSDIEDATVAVIGTGEQWVFNGTQWVQTSTNTDHSKLLGVPVGSLTHATINSYLDQAVATVSSPYWANIGVVDSLLLGFGTVSEGKLWSGSGEARWGTDASGTYLVRSTAIKTPGRVCAWSGPNSITDSGVDISASALSAVRNISFTSGAAMADTLWLNGTALSYSNLATGSSLVRCVPSRVAGQLAYWTANDSIQSEGFITTDGSGTLSNIVDLTLSGILSNTNPSFTLTSGATGTRITGSMQTRALLTDCMRSAILNPPSITADDTWFQLSTWTSASIFRGVIHIQTRYLEVRVHFTKSGAAFLIDGVHVPVNKSQSWEVRVYTNGSSIFRAYVRMQVRGCVWQTIDRFTNFPLFTLTNRGTGAEPDDVDGSYTLMGAASSASTYPYYGGVQQDYQVSAYPFKTYSTDLTKTATVTCTAAGDLVLGSTSGTTVMANLLTTGKHTTLFSTPLVWPSFQAAWYPGLTAGYFGPVYNLYNRGAVSAVDTVSPSCLLTHRFSSAVAAGTKVGSRVMTLGADMGTANPSEWGLGIDCWTYNGDGNASQRGVDIGVYGTNSAAPVPALNLLSPDSVCISNTSNTTREAGGYLRISAPDGASSTCTLTHVRTAGNLTAGGVVVGNTADCTGIGTGSFRTGGGISSAGKIYCTEIRQTNVTYEYLNLMGSLHLSGGSAAVYSAVLGNAATDSIELANSPLERNAFVSGTGLPRYWVPGSAISGVAKVICSATQAAAVLRMTLSLAFKNLNDTTVPAVVNAMTTVTIDITANQLLEVEFPPFDTWAITAGACCWGKISRTRPSGDYYTGSLWLVGLDLKLRADKVGSV